MRGKKGGRCEREEEKRARKIKREETKEGAKGKPRAVREEEIESCLEWTQKTQRMFRIRDYAMMDWYGSTMPGVSVG